MCLPRSLTAASPCSYHRTVISRSDGYSVVNDRDPLIFFGQRGVKIQPCCQKKYLFFFRSGMFLSLLLLVQKNGFARKNLKTSLNFLLVGKFSEWAKLFSDYINHLHLHPSIFLMATFLRLCTKLFSEQQKSLPSVSRKGLVTPYEARMRKQKTPHDNKTDFSVSFFIRCLGSLIRTNA